MSDNTRVMETDTDTYRFLRDVCNFTDKRAQELAATVDASLKQANSTFSEIATFCWTVQKEVFVGWGLSTIEMGKIHIALKKLR